ncbi:hypothetical protein [Microbacterium rhizomatis]|uniref:Uncharacterized protein n=1 Tax=Microbacterium rhizomatis TaxID=1631477 RepID=A0A5J5IZX5_9MICO|nr:hypothetical protein [Microbacterium rhizomatis]KAA9106444.1 hypothetical protein F6B43_14960 [Microbacterium rhizomatis]
MSAELLLGLGGTVDDEIAWDAAVLEGVARYDGIRAPELDASAPDEAAEALARVRPLIPAPTLVVHTKHWALAHGAGAGRWRDALEGASAMAATRFRVGDALTADEYEATIALPRQGAAVAFARALERRLGDDVAVVPSYFLDVAAPTTIGLGDSFVGGFIASLARADASATAVGTAS